MNTLRRNRNNSYNFCNLFKQNFCQCKTSSNKSCNKQKENPICSLFVVENFLCNIHNMHKVINIYNLFK